MADNVSDLRKILFDVVPAKVLIDRKLEIPLLPPELKGTKKPATREEEFKIADSIKEFMVSFLANMTLRIKSYSKVFF